MSRFVRIRGVIMLLALVLVPLVVYPFAGGWTFLWAPVLLLFVALALVLSTVLDNEPVSVFTAPEREPEVAPGPWTTRVRETVLVSADDDYVFVFSATVRWRWTDVPEERMPNPASLAEQQAVATARDVAEKYTPRECDVARHRLAADLGVVTIICGGTVEMWAEDVTLNLPEEDADRLARLAEIRKERNKWQVERDVEITKREYFAENVFASPGSAVIWELVRNGADVAHTAGLVRTLAYLSEAGKGEDLADLRERLRGWEPELASAMEGIGEGPVPGGYATPVWMEGVDEAPGEPAAVPDPVEVLIREIDTIEDDHERVTLADRLARVLTESRLTAFAPRLREHFGIPPNEAPPPAGFVNGAGPSPNGSAGGAAR